MIDKLWNDRWSSHFVFWIDLRAALMGGKTRRMCCPFKPLHVVTCGPHTAGLLASISCAATVSHFTCSWRAMNLTKAVQGVVQSQSAHFQPALRIHSQSQGPGNTELYTLKWGPCCGDTLTLSSVCGIRSVLPLSCEVRVGNTADSIVWPAWGSTTWAHIKAPTSSAVMKSAKLSLNQNDPVTSLFSSKGHTWELLG